jgi:NAD(P)-dependent dehydrogenase (short-subunit alcohol dehydrogenase family)
MFPFWFWLKRRVPQSYKPVILVTGCSSGIGAALARLLHGYDGYRVVVTARASSLPKLRSRYNQSERFLIRPLDVTSAAERDVLIEEIRRVWGGVDVLINNAGISYRAVLEHMTEADELKQMATNYFGPMALIRAVLPSMREKGRGKIINVSSVSGMIAMPTMSAYSASKYALEGASEALWYEVKPLGISVSLIQPGFIHSNSFQNVYYTEDSRPENWSTAIYGDYYSHMTPFIEKLMKKSRTTPESLARLILKVIQTQNPPLWIAATLDAWAFYYIRRLVPRRFLMPLLFSLLPRARTWGEGYSHRRRR